MVVKEPNRFGLSINQFIIDGCCICIYELGFLCVNHCVDRVINR